MSYRGWGGTGGVGGWISGVGGGRAVFLCAAGAEAAGASGGATQLIEPIVLAPYWTYPAWVGGECWAVIGK